MEKKKIKESYNAQEKEAYWQEFWEEERINKFNPDSSKELFTIDTPPPTISGSLHIGHAFSYIQAEVIARYRKLAGFNVRYPIGMDNNGLPTERLVEKERGIQGHNLSLDDFVGTCFEVCDEYKKDFHGFWKSFGMSFDWDLEYLTISSEVQKLAQTVFKELFDKKVIYRKDAVALYCCSCQTSVAQAELEDKEYDSVFYDIAFKRSGDKEVIISTTRPELLPACVGLFVNPEDNRYKKIIGEIITTPLGDSIEVIADDKVSIEKGTGAVMCCTYGDETDVAWVREYSLAEKVVLAKNGKFIELKGFSEVSGKSIKEVRKIIVSKLEELGAIRGRQAIKHIVNVHERCGTPIEFIPTKQWFLKTLNKKEELLKAGEKINWYPAYMKKRYESWVNGLKWDWSISRERFFGIPVPVSVCNSCEYLFVPDKTDFPIDLRSEEDLITCPKCKKGSLVSENLVLDTWFTSALTPDINNEFPGNGKLKGKMYPMSMRPIAHDIIRTWVFYTILMGIYRHQDIPWKNLMISGHILLEKGKKVSKKTGGSKFKPKELVKEFSADAVRYAMCGALLGRDAIYEEKEIKNGKRLITKLYNAGKLIISNLEDFSKEAIKDESNLETIDKWILFRSRLISEEMKKRFDEYEISKALKLFEDFFWKDFCDNYLEIVKGRLWNNENQSELKRQSAQYAVYHSYLNILKMIAPFLPHIAEEMYHIDYKEDGTTASEKTYGFFAMKEKEKSIHLSSWPTQNNKDESLNKDEIKGIDLMLKIITEIRKYKTDKQIKLGAELPIVNIKLEKEKEMLLSPFLDDLKFTIKANKILFQNENNEIETNHPIIAI